MANYTKTTNFTSKDSLSTGNPLKIIRGSEHDTEYSNIATAIQTKADTVSPALTGTATAVNLTVSGTLLVGSDTATSNTATQTLTNKTLTSPTINGGTITGITDLTVADGGTGASTFTANAVLLGNGTSALQVVAPSTSGNILTSNGTTWVSSTLPAGSTLQVVQTFFTTSFTTSSNSMTDITGMSLNITPKSATSKILLITSMSTSKSTAGSGIAFQWVRNGTAVGIGTLGTTAPNYSFAYTQAGASSINNVNFSYLDSPATTSALTYKLQVRVESAGGTFALNNNPSYLNGGTDVYHAGYTSTITAIEVSA